MENNNGKKTQNGKTERPNTGSSCDYCAHYDWDDDGESYECTMALDEDEMVYFLQGRFQHCPYFQAYDEYKIARKQ